MRLGWMHDDGTFEPWGRVEVTPDPIMDAAQLRLLIPRFEVESAREPERAIRYYTDRAYRQLTEFFSPSVQVVPIAGLEKKQ